jgi:SAM-dependent methyltransferase
MSCYLCSSTSITQIHDRCRDSLEVKVMRCDACGLVFLSDARTITGDFYEKSGMYEFVMPARAALLEEESADTARRIELLRPLVKGKRLLDFGCGAGAVVLGLSDVAAEAYGVELNQLHREALGAISGIRVARNLVDLPGEFDVISLFHVLEHLQDPIAELAQLRARLAPGGRLMVEVPSSRDALLSLFDVAAFKNFTYWTPHLYLFDASTLSTVLSRAGFQKYEVRFVQRYPFVNHLYWLAKGKPGGHKVWAHLSSPALDEAYAIRLGELEASDTLLAIAAIS